MPRGREGRGEAKHEEEALLTGSRCRCPEVTTCPRLCNAGGAPGELQAEGEAGGGLTAPSLSRRPGPSQPGAPTPPDWLVRAATAGLGPRCPSCVIGLNSGKDRLDLRSLRDKAARCPRLSPACKARPGRGPTRPLLRCGRTPGSSALLPTPASAEPGPGSRGGPSSWQPVTLLLLFLLVGPQLDLFKIW